MIDKNIVWIPPYQCAPPHKITHKDKFLELVEQFKIIGWNLKEPALIGYPFNRGVQLISGSHRWAAAMIANILIPVKIHEYEYIYEIWGKDGWLELIKNPPRIL